MDFILAHSRFRRQRFPQAIALCDQMLATNSRDEAAWVLKCQCLVKENLIDELETEEEGIAELMIKEEQSNKFARAGTSFKGSANANPVMRPLNSGRLNTGFQRAGTSVGSRAGSRNNMLRTGRIMTKGGVPATSNGRVLRLATASLQQYGQNFFDSSKADFKKLAQRRSKARLIFQYLFYVQHNVKKCLQLAVMATQINGYEDPWWKLALGKCYYHLGFWKEGQRQLLSSVGHNHSVQAYLYLSKIYEKQDNVERAINVLQQGKKAHPFQPKLDIAVGRIYDQLHDLQRSNECYKRALSMQNCNIEAVANIAAYCFYKQQPQIALKLYQRLIQLGYQSPQIWNNMALCCFANHQYQLFYSCFERGLIGAQDDPLIISDVWYNVGYVYTLMGEKEMALEAYKLAVGQRPDHSEALNNMAVIEASRGKIDAAINYAEKAHREWPGFESAYNLSLWYFKTNQLEKANALNLQALRFYPSHAESRQLKIRLLRKLDSL